MKISFKMTRTVPHHAKPLQGLGLLVAGMVSGGKCIQPQNSAYCTVAAAG